MINPEYIQRIHRVVDYISANISDELSLATLANVAHWSPFHFHRIFAAVTGESVANFVKRVRLECAAHFLAYHPDKSILDIALICGYQTNASFSKAFKDLHGVSPSEWRDQASNNRKIGQQDSKIGKADAPTWKVEWNQRYTSPQENIMEVSIKQLPNYQIAYMRHVGAYGPAAIPALWQRMNSWAEVHGLMNENTITIGISRDDPSVTPPEKCRYDACIVTDKKIDSKDVNYTTFSGGPYAVTEFVGTPQEIQKGWMDFYSWLIHSRHQPDAKPVVEIYQPGSILDPKTMKFRCELGIAVQKS